MKPSDIVKIQTIVLDPNLDVIATSIKEYKGYNFYDLLSPPKSAIRDAMRSLKEMQSISADISISTPLTPIEQYSVVILRTPSHYFLTLVPLTPAMQLVETVTKLEEYAYTDQLTGALNRHAYWKLLETMLYEIGRENLGLGVIFLDIDGLKGINTNSGYAEGDSAIAFVAKCAQKSLRKYDLLIRMGGDEFLAIFRIDPKKDFTVEDMAMRILNTVRRESGGNISVSIGANYIKPGVIHTLVSGPKWKKAWNNLYNDLDSKLRKAKKEGKNQAILSL